MNEIDPAAVIQQRLAEGMGLDKYSLIEGAVNMTDVSADAEFQRLFNGFYRVRRNAAWRAEYYRLFESVKRSGRTEFGYILDELFRLTGNVEASFASKMLATLRPEMPIWDRYVLENLALKAPARTDPERLEKAKSVYDCIVQWYEDFLSTENAKECLEKFDAILPGYAWFSDVKKIDFYLWSIR